MIYLLPLFTVMIWGGNAIVNMMAISVIEPSAICFFRWFFAMLILTPFCLPSMIKNADLIKPHLLKLAILALIGMVLNQSLGYYAAETTTASNMSFISALIPLISIFISVPLLGTKISINTIIGALISLFGLSFMLGKGDPLFILDQSITQGDGFMILASLCYALYCILLKRWKIPLPNWQLIYVQGLFSVLMLCPLWLRGESLIPTVDALPLIAYATVAASILAPWMWIIAIDKIGASTSALFMNITPLFVAFLASTFLNEQIKTYHIIGGVLVIFGVILAQLKLQKKITTETTQSDLELKEEKRVVI